MPKKHPILPNKLNSESNLVENFPKTVHRLHQKGLKGCHWRAIRIGSGRETMLGSPRTSAKNRRSSHMHRNGRFYQTNFGSNLNRPKTNFKTVRFSPESDARHAQNDALERSNVPHHEAATVACAASGGTVTHRSAPN